MKKHKAGFVNIIGIPNVGKSTLMNALVGEKLSIITPKAQTTRHRIIGIVNSEDYQIVFSDTPGILKPFNKLHESMMRFVISAITDADILMFVTDVHQKLDDAQNEKLFSAILKINAPVFLLLNKIDLINESEITALLEKWKNKINAAVTIPISALLKKNIHEVLDNIIRLLPEHPPFYDKTELTDKPEKFFVSEMIREQIYKHYRQEIPYSTEIVIESFKDEAKIIRIGAVIYVSRESQKPILIGRKGLTMKKIGTDARKEMEEFLGKKVFLALYVRVSENWRDNEKALKKFGY